MCVLGNWIRRAATRSVGLIRATHRWLCRAETFAAIAVVLLAIPATSVAMSGTSTAGGELCLVGFAGSAVGLAVVEGLRRLSELLIKWVENSADSGGAPALPHSH